MTLAYVGLGSNLGDRESLIRRAAELIGATRLSTIRETEPWGLRGPAEVPERRRRDRDHARRRAAARPPARRRARLGRERVGPKWGPRTIDLDLLLYGDETVDEPGLVVPHPRLLEREFVLEPLAELVPWLKIPGNGTVHDALAGLQSEP